MKINSFQPYVPIFIDKTTLEPQSILFETTQDLLNLEIVKRYQSPTFSHFEMSGRLLVSVRKNGDRWIVGTVLNPEDIDLPSSIAYWRNKEKI